MDEDLRDVENALSSAGDDTTILNAARKLRQLLNNHRETLIQHVLGNHWIPLLLEWLQPQRCAAVQVEALWALTNIAAGASEHTHLLIKHGAVPILISLLGGSNEEVLEQAIWVLGNLAGEGTSARDVVINSNAIGPIVLCVQCGCSSLSIMRIGSWTLSNLCDGQPRPAVDIRVVLPVLSQLLHNGKRLVSSIENI